MSTPADAVVLLNAGAQRRTGPGRLHATLARRWAAQGLLVLRVDLSGLGDSAPAPGAADNIVYSPTAVAETVAVVQALRQRWPVRRCVLLGLCAGAYHGLKAAGAGAEVEQVIAINPLTFFWQEGTPLEMLMPAHLVTSEMARYRSGLFAAERWRKLLRGQVDLRRIAGLLWRRAVQAIAAPARDLARLLRLPLRHDLAAELRSLAHRGVKLDVVVAEGDPGEQLLRAEAGRTVDALLRSGALAIHRVEHADHTFTGAEARERVVTLLTALAGSPDEGDGRCYDSSSIPSSRPAQASRTMPTKSAR